MTENVLILSAFVIIYKLFGSNRLYLSCVFGIIGLLMLATGLLIPFPSLCVISGIAFFVAFNNRPTYRSSLEIMPAFRKIERRNAIRP